MCSHWRQQGALVGALLVLLGSGCAYTGNQLGPLQLSQISRDGSLRPVGYAYTVSPSGTILSPEVVEKGLRMLKPAFASMESGSDRHPLHLSFQFRNERGALKRAGLVTLSALTLTLVPVRLRDPIVLEVAFSSQGQLLETYRYDDYVDTWVQLLMIPVDSEHRRGWAVQRVVNHMLMHFLRDYQARPLRPGGRRR
jgi:hypothetical protein